MDVLAELWSRAIAVQPPLDQWVVLVTGAVALLLTVVAWPVVRLLITICHEAGHATVALLAGRRLSGIKLHTDTSGVTVTKGRPTGPGMVATLFAGYPTASLTGLAAAVVAASGHAGALLWGFVALLAVMLLAIRNVYGALVVLVVGGIVATVSWFAPAPILAIAAYLLAWLLLWGGTRPVIEVARSRSATSDPAQLASLTRLPKFVWLVVWFVICIGSLVWGAAAMLPAVLAGLPAA
jgi:hypothetical protein